MDLRRVSGGRFTDWTFDQMQVGDGLRALSAEFAPHTVDRGRIPIDSFGV